MITALLVRFFNSSRSILCEMRRRDAESQYEKNGAQDDLMFLHDGFSFRWERANALLAHRLAYVSTHCLINADTDNVKYHFTSPITRLHRSCGDYVRATHNPAFQVKILAATQGANLNSNVSVNTDATQSGCVCETPRRCPTRPKIPAALTTIAGVKVRATEKIKPREKLKVANRSASIGQILRTINSANHPPVKNTFAAMP